MPFGVWLSSSFTVSVNPIMTRASLVGLCLLLALPLIITFESLLLWQVTLGVSEYGHRLALLPLLLMVWSWRQRAWWSLSGAAIAMIVFLSPLVTAFWMARDLPSALDRAFGETPRASGTVLHPISLWFGKAPSASAPEFLTLPGEGNIPARRIAWYPCKREGAPSPCILVVHGGSWQSGSADEFSEWSEYWTTQGYAVASVEYRLAPKWQWPDQAVDVHDSLDFLKKQAQNLGIDPTKFVLLGRSAGGQIATAYAYGFRDPAIVGCISLYAPGDMLFAYRFADSKDVLDSPKLLRQYLRGLPEAVPGLYRSASGTLIARPDSPPTLIVHGRQDILVWHLQSRRLDAQLDKVGIPHYFLDLPWAVHGLDYPFQGPSAQLTRYAVDRFLEKICR